MLEVRTLKRGDVVVALHVLDEAACNVAPGAVGVVFEEAEWHEVEPTEPPASGAATAAAWGPMVRFPGYGCVNVYPGDVTGPGGDERSKLIRDATFAAAEVQQARIERRHALDTVKVLAEGRRRKLPVERAAIIHKFDIVGHEGYLHVGLYGDSTPGEVFIVMAKEGSTISGLMDTIAVLISIALQHGVPLSIIVDKLKDAKYEPSGTVNNPISATLRHAHSVTDYIARYLAFKFLPGAPGEKLDQFEAGRPVGGGE